MSHHIAPVLALLLCTQAFALSPAPTTEPAWTQTKYGELMLRPFANAPYPHSSRENGYKGKIETYPKAGHYDDSTVGIFIPRGYVANDKVNYVVHFHGHKNNVANVLMFYRLPEQLAESNVNAILIVPQGPKDAADSGFGKLELDKNGLKNLLDEISLFLKREGKIKTTAIGDVVLSAHSGGYKVTAAVLDHGGLSDHITDVHLLDASYGNLEWFSAWCASDKRHRLVSLFTDHLADANKELMGLLTKAGVKYQILDEATLKDSSLATRGPIFMHTSLAHNDVPMKKDYFRRLLQTSALASNHE